MNRLLATCLFVGCATGPAPAQEPVESPGQPAPATDAPAPASDMAAEDEPFTFTFKDFEVVGYKTTTREALVQDLPVDIGDPAGFPDEETVAEWDRLAEQKADELGLHHVGYSMVQFAEGDAYFTVDVLEAEDQEIVDSRAAPTDEISLPKELDELDAAREDRQRELFSTGQYMKTAEVVAQTDDGQVYLSYPKDEELEALARKLARTAPPHRETLVRAVGHAKSAAVRARAATLLNWAGDATTSIAEVVEYTDDPAGVVRNNITRFALHYIDRIESRDTKEALVRATCVQLHRPSHADRNKALFGLLRLVEADESVAELIPDGCVERVELVARQSVLDNVGGVAKKLLPLIDGARRADDR